jgi:hypothetical protein
MKVETRGRQAVNDTVIKQYTQVFKDHKGEIATWEWDKNINPYGPISVTVKDPFWSVFDKKEKQLAELLERYEPKGNERKPRITKADKELIEQLEYEINEIWYESFPEDRGSKKGKNKLKTLI